MEKLLILKMERMKKQMIELARLKGLDHPDVLMISQEIDEVHNRINRLSYMQDRKDKKCPGIRRFNDKIKENSYIQAYLYAASGI